VLAPPEHDLAERAQLPGGRVDGDDPPRRSPRPGPAPPRGPRRRQGTDRGLQPGPDPGQQGSKTAGQRQPAARPLQVA
jgi:hypothetical protein